VTKKRILILGGGFGGVYVAVHLGRILSTDELERTEIALVNRENYVVFQPLLPEVISGSVALNHVIAPIRRMAPRASLYTCDIESIDPVARTVTLSPGIRPTALVLDYDQLVIAEAVVERDGLRVVTLGSGDVFGEAALISNQPRNATVRASTPVDTVAVSRQAFQQLLRHLPGLNETMRQLMCGRPKERQDLNSIDC
jgi:CRP-like cAMP-binding protein